MPRVPVVCLRGWIPVLLLLLAGCLGAASEETNGPAAGQARRWVGESPVPPFGCVLESSDSTGFTWAKGFLFAHLAAWPGPGAKPEEAQPLAYGKWTGGPYHNAAGERWVKRINGWYEAGTAAGLTQDTFRSFDDKHSSLRPGAFPQLQFAEPRAALGNPAKTIFRPRVTLGVQSYGIDGHSVIESRIRAALRRYYETGAPVTMQRTYRTFYENNFLFVAPAVGTFKPGRDTFAFLSPFYLHSVGASGTDARLMKPLVMASAALPPELKTRILRKGLYVPALMYLFKESITGGIRGTEAHVPAYSLPDAAKHETEEDAPFLDRLITAAHELKHIPPVCRLHVTDMRVEDEEDRPNRSEIYKEVNTYAVTAALRHGQTLVLDVDLRYSWTDHNLPVAQYFTEVLRGEAAITRRNDEGSRLRIRIPWRLTNNRDDLRTDILLLADDGTYAGAPAYISVRHLHRHDPLTLGIKKRPRP